MALNRLLKVLFGETIEKNLDLKFSYVPSKENPADEGSRVFSPSDARLSERSWRKLQAWAGPHSCDLMALDSNAMKGEDGEPLRHFTPWNTPESSGVDVFAQEVGEETNPYVFPPFIMIMPILLLLKEQEVKGCTIVVPRRQKKEVWWCLLRAHVVREMVLIKEGEVGGLTVPTKRGWDSSRPAPCDLVACRVAFK